jgi:hypothetical protein
MTKEIFIKMTLDSWNARVHQADKLLASLSDEQLLKEIAPGKNRGVYLLGHLTAVHDSMMTLLNLGEPLYPALFKPFVESPDKTVNDIPSVAELRTYWTNVNANLSKHFIALSPDDWFKKHNSVSEEDFAKEPHRNRLNIVLTRTNHFSYHLGQLALLK